MLNLNSNTSLHLSTTVAGDIRVSGSYVDINPSTNPAAIIVGSITMAPILSIADTVIVAPPAASYGRNVKQLTIRNKGLVDHPLTVNQVEGTNITIPWEGTLKPGNWVTLNENGNWIVYDKTTGSAVGSGTPSGGGVSGLPDPGSNGLMVRTTTNTLTPRVIANGSTKVSVVNGDGLAGNPTIDIVESALNLANMGGTTGAVNIKGTWNATSNVPALASGTGVKGDSYRVATAGTTVLDGVSSWSVGDVVSYDGTAWVKLVGASTGSGGALIDKGTWNATTNTPALVSATGTKGDTYRVSVAGTTPLDGISAWAIGDVISYSGTAWIKLVSAPVTGAKISQGTWNASTNTPTLASGAGTKGFTYTVATAGTTTIDGISSWAVGDEISFDGTVWRKTVGIDNPGVTADKKGYVVKRGINSYSTDIFTYARRSVSGYANGLMATYQAALTSAGDSLTERQKDALNYELGILAISGVLAKVRDLWVPLGSLKAGAYVKIKTATGSLATIAEVGAATYDPAIGIIGNGTSSRLNTGFNPTAAAFDGSSWGMGAFNMAPVNTALNGTLAGTATGTTDYLGVGPTGGSRINNTLIDNTISAMPKFTAAQVSAGFAQQWFGSHLRARLAVAGAMPNVVFNLLSTNGSFFSNARLGGWAAWTPALTESEMQILSMFFENINAALLRPVFGTSLAAIGDSNTFGTGVTTTQRWPYLVATALGIANNSSAEFNDGVHGSTVADCLATAARKYNTSIRVQPVLLTSMFGTNDIGFGLISAATFKTQYKELLDIQTKGGIESKKILLMSPIWGDFDNNPANYHVHPNLIPPFTQAVKELADENDCMFYDPYPVTLANNATWYQSDNLHLNIAGHVGISNEVQKYLATYFS